MLIHECDAAWWAEERKVGRAFVRARAYEKQHEEQTRREQDAHAAGGVGLDTDKFNLQWASDQVEVSMFTHTDDVQTRQCLVMSRVLRDLWAAGYDWMLQLDIDELLYLPRLRPH